MIDTTNIYFRILILIIGDVVHGSPRRSGTSNFRVPTTRTFPRSQEWTGPRSQEWAAPRSQGTAVGPPSRTRPTM